jgi:hypothetical protein
MGRKNESKKLEYDEKAMELGIRLYEKGEIPLTLLYHLLKSKRLNSFSAVMIQSDMEDFGVFLKEQKRKTDLLFDIEAAENIYVMFCQETKVDGGFYFVRRLVKELEESGKGKIKAAIIAVESAKYPIRDLMFIILDTYIKVVKSDEVEDVLFRTIR